MKLSQEDHEFESSLKYIARACLKTITLNKELTNSMSTSESRVEVFRRFRASGQGQSGVSMKQCLRKVNGRPKSKLRITTKGRSHPRKRRTHKQTMYVVRNLCLAYVKSAYNSIIKKTANPTKKWTKNLKRQFPK